MCRLCVKMSTSLAEQLKRLAAPQTSLLVHKTKKASFLFDGKQAAEFDKDTIYELGYSGLQELKKINGIFGAFESTLFDETSRKFERAVEGREANVKLDRHIKRLLFALSPYFVLKSSHKVLEWLIHRFHIEEYNVDSIMALILPYHETKLFARMIQIIPLKDDKNLWFWLESIQKNGIPLPKISLLTRAACDPGFFKFVCNLPMQAIQVWGKKSEVLSTLFAFYCTTVIGGIEKSPKVTELQVTHLLPSLMAGINSPYVDFASSAFMILGHIATKTKFSVRILKELFNKVAKSEQPQLDRERCLLLVVLSQSQLHDGGVTLSAIRHLASTKWFIISLSDLAVSGIVVYPLVSAIVEVCRRTLWSSEGERRKHNVLEDFVSKLLEVIRFDNSEVEKLFKVMIVKCGDNQKRSAKFLKWNYKIINDLEKRYPEAFDKAVEAVPEILNFAPNHTPRVAIFEKLHHATDHVRIEALKHVAENADILQETWIRDSVAECLNDDSTDVVKVLLSFPQHVFCDLLSKDELLKCLINILAKAWRTDSELTSKALQQLCFMDGDETLLLIVVMPYLLTGRDVNVQCILDSPLTSKIKFLECVKKSILENYDKKTVVNTVYKQLADIKLLPECEKITYIVISYFGGNTSLYPVYVFMGAVLAAAALPLNASLAQIEALLELLSLYTGSYKLKMIEGIQQLDRNTVRKLTRSCRDNSLPVQGAFYILACIMHKNEFRKVQLGFWNRNDPSVAVPFGIIKHILSTSAALSSEEMKNAYLKCRTEFFKEYFPSTESQVCFLANIMFGCTSVEVLNACVQLILDLLQKCKGDISWTVDLKVDNVLVPAVVFSLFSPDVNLRESTLTLIKWLAERVLMQEDRVHRAFMPDQGGYLLFLKEILARKEEIITDHEQITVALYMLLSPDPSVRSLLDSQLQKKMSKVLDTLITIVVSDATPDYVTASLLKLLAEVNSVEMFGKLLPTALKIISEHGELQQQQQYTVGPCQSEIFGYIMSRINATTVECFQQNEVWLLAEKCLKDQRTAVLVELDQSVSPAVMFLKQISKELFAELSEENQCKLLTMVVQAAAETENSEVSSASNSLFKHIVLDSSVVVRLLIKMRDAIVPTAATSHSSDKRRRRMPQPIALSLQLLTTTEWKQGVCLLEFIQNKKKLNNVDMLLPVLFDILKKCLEFEEQAPVEYIKQLLLSSILHCCQKLSPDGSAVDVPEKTLQIELVVQCIRASHNPQTHHHALLVLSYTASMIPDQVLHNIIEIFTFMGSSVLRQDDAYSFQIISKIVETIIPVLIQKCESSDSLFIVITGILRVFAGATMDIPLHRRLPILIKLLNTLADGTYLWVYECLMFEFHVLHPMHSEDAVPKRLVVCLQLAMHFEAQVVIQNCYQILRYLSCMPFDKDDKRVVALQRTPLGRLFSVEQNTGKQLRHYMYTMLTFLSMLLSSSDFVAKIASLNDDEASLLEDDFNQLVEITLQYIQAVSKQADVSANVPTAKYWRVMFSQCYDVLDKIIALLPGKTFLKVVRHLMSHPITMLRRKSMELLNWRLQQSQPLEPSVLLELLPTVVSVIRDICPNEPVSQDVQLTQQTALITVKLLARHLAAGNPSQFQEILLLVTTVTEHSTSVSEPVLASVVLCLGELSCTLRAHSLAMFPRFMPGLIQILHSQTTPQNSEIMLLSIVSAVLKVVESLSHFLSPYLDRLLFEIAILSDVCQHQVDNQKIQPVVQKLKTIRQKISADVPLRVLLPAVAECHSRLIARSQISGLPHLMSILGDSFTSGSDLSPDMLTFFLTALDFRSRTDSREDVDLVEPSVIAAVLALVLKLSESSFRPFYYKIYDWAFRSDKHKERSITFYRLTNRIAECLKGLFVLFANYFLKNAATLLNENNTVKTEETQFGSDPDGIRKSCELVTAILKSLLSVFVHDSSHFINKERFDTIMQPVVDQLENSIGGKQEVDDRCKNLVIPCIAQMAVSAGDDTLWKQLNYQILLKTRHSQKQVRLAGLYSVFEVAKKLGEDFLPMLPETVPFLAELMEDEDEEVEKQCTHVVQDLETVLGEPLQKYF